MLVCLSVCPPAVPAISCAPVAVAAAGIVLTDKEGGDAEKEREGLGSPRAGGRGGRMSHHSSARALCKYGMGEEATGV